VLAAHVPLLHFLGFREVICNFFYIDEWPREIISFANSLEPGGFCWEARRTMEVPNSGFNTGEFIYVVEVLLAVILAHLECYMFTGDLVCFDGVHGVEAVLSRWMIQDERKQNKYSDSLDFFCVNLQFLFVTSSLIKYWRESNLNSIHN
jgi:hypothetical protein